MNRVIFVNGPRDSGKDTAVGFMVKHFGARTYKMAWPIKRSVQTMFSLSEQEYNLLFETEQKNYPAPRLYDKTPREVLIDFSERWAKQLFGQDVFGRLSVRFMKSPSDTPFTAVSDSRFREECFPLVKWLGGRNCLVVQLWRQGRSFEGESGSYWDLTDLGVPLIEVRNDFDMEIYELQIKSKVGKWLDELQNAK